MEEPIISFQKWHEGVQRPQIDQKMEGYAFRCPQNEYFDELATEV